MSDFKISIDLNVSSEFTAAVVRLANAVAALGTVAAEPAAPKATAKATAKTQPPKVEADEPVAEAPVEKAAAPAREAFDRDDLEAKVKAALQRVNKVHGRTAVVDALANFKAQRITELSDGDLPAALAAFTKLADEA